MSGVVLLNASYEPLQLVSVPHAIRMLVREVAVVEDGDHDKPIGPFPWPRVLRLVRYVYAQWKHNRPRRAYSRTAVLARDGHSCRYCGEHATTIDHVLPSSRGGATSFANTVAACQPCNEAKGCRTPEEAGMMPLWPIGR